MEAAIATLQQDVANMEKDIETLNWKISRIERVLFSSTKLPHSGNISSILIRLAETCHKYEELVSLVSERRNEQVEFTDILRLQVNLLQSRVQTIRALITKGRTIEL